MKRTMAIVTMWMCLQNLLFGYKKKDKLKKRRKYERQEIRSQYDHEEKLHQNSVQTIPPFPSHMTLKDASSLKVHDKIDHRDPVGRYILATVEDKQGTNLKIHYDGWSKK
eukprot:937150_1